MTTDYNPIAEQYRQSKQQPWRTWIECFTLLELVGDVQGVSVVDVACGEGFYTRLLKARGAGPVTGVDLSPGMIELARQQEARQPLGIEYHVADARALPELGQRQLAVAAYLLNYARNRDELTAMARGIADSLPAGGRFVTVNCNPAQDFRRTPSYRKYGFETQVRGAWEEGAPIGWRFHLADRTFDIENYFLSPEAHERALREAGFREVHWHPARLAPQATVEGDVGFWEDFLEHPPIAFIECVK